MRIRNLLPICMTGAMLISLPSCNGIFEDLYDDPEQTTYEVGFGPFDEATKSGYVYVDATKYTQWHYIDFDARTICTVDIDTETKTSEVPDTWHIAIHRYDAKTNGAEVLETSATGFDVLRSAGSLPSGSWVEDEWSTNRITIDMSGMMDGVILYAEDYYNPCLSLWLDVDTSVMPPIYTLSKKVYLCRFSDGQIAALHLTNFMNDAGDKGYMLIEYVYPFEL